MGKLQKLNANSSVISPVVDGLCCGGASLAFVLGVIFYGIGMPADWGQEISGGEIIWANILINWPHFMSSYRILYRSRQEVREHAWVALALPTALVLLFVAGIATAGYNPPDQPGLANQALVETLFPIGVLLLAWHYTGQSWGMTASFLYIRGIRMTRSERWLIRSGYHALLVFHVMWVLADVQMLTVMDMLVPNGAVAFLSVYAIWPAILLLSFVAGCIGFYRIGRRNRCWPPMRAWFPWVATYSWYVLIYYYPAFFFVLQFSHALQYIIFTVRVEMNQYSADHPRIRQSAARHGVYYYIALVAVGAIVFDGLKLVTTPFDPSNLLTMLVAVLINVHHYFIDGVIWKIRDPKVKNRLFGHLSAS